MTGIEHELVEVAGLFQDGGVLLLVQRQQFLFLLVHGPCHVVLRKGLVDVGLGDQLFRGKQHEVTEELAFELIGQVDGFLCIVSGQFDAGAEGLARPAALVRRCRWGRLADAKRSWISAAISRPAVGPDMRRRR